VEGNTTVNLEEKNKALNKHQIKGTLISLGFILIVSFLGGSLRRIFWIILVLLCLLAVPYYIVSRSIRTIRRQESENRKENQ
jgi:hypothetical protein